MSMTTIRYDDIKEEIDYEKYLPLDLIGLFESIINQYNNPKLLNVSTSIQKNMDRYNNVCDSMRQNYLSNINIIPFEQNNISVSIEKSYAIENEEVNSREESYKYFVDIYSDINYCRRFNVNFVKNIKQMSKKLNLRNAGKFKDRQNDCSISHTKYDILPVSYQNVNKYLKSLIDFLNYPVGSDFIFIKAVLIHIYFEAIHPFSDGNGRIGRFILNNNLNVYLKNPIYLDAEILSNRDTYYKNLLLFNTNEKQIEVMTWFLELIDNTLVNSIKSCEDILIKNKSLVKFFNELDLFNNELNKLLAIAFSYSFGIQKETIYTFLAPIYKDNRSKQKVIDKLLEQKIITQKGDYYYLINNEDRM